MCRRVPWTAEEVGAAVMWYQVLGHEWGAVAEMLGGARTAEELYALYKYTGGFTQSPAHAAETVYRIRRFCSRCREDNAADEMLRCHACKLWYHQMCSGAPRVAQWLCSQQCALRCGSRVFRPDAETPLLRTSAGYSYVYLCCHRDCRPGERAARYRLHGERRAPHYGVAGNARPNLRRHMHDCHHVARHVPFDALLHRGLVRRVPVTRVTNLHSDALPAHLRAPASPVLGPHPALSQLSTAPGDGDNNNVFHDFGDPIGEPFANSGNGERSESGVSPAVHPMPEHTLEQSAPEPYLMPEEQAEDGLCATTPLATQLVATATPLATPLVTTTTSTKTTRGRKKQQQRACDGSDPPLQWLEHLAPDECPAGIAKLMGRAAPAMRESLAKFRWGTRCAACTALETPMPAAGTGDALPPLEAAYTPVLPPEELAEPLMKSLAAELARTASVPTLPTRVAAIVQPACRAFTERLCAVVRWQLKDCVGGGGLAPFGHDAPRCWILSLATPLIDVAATVVPGRVLTCPAGDYAEVRAGDTVFFWADVYYPEQVLPCTLSKRPPSVSKGSDPAGLIGVGRVLQGPRFVHEFGIVRKRTTGGASSGSQSSSQVASSQERYFGEWNDKGENDGDAEEEEEEEEETGEEHSVINRIALRVDTRFAQGVELAALAKSPALNQKQLSSVPGLHLIPLRDSQAASLQAILAKSGTTPLGNESLRAEALQLLRTLTTTPGAEQHSEIEVHDEEHPALAWLAATGRVVLENGRMRVRPPLATLGALRAVLEHEAALGARHTLCPGCCAYCRAPCAGQASCACHGRCGQAVHEACLPHVAPAPSAHAHVAWRCAGCADPGTNPHACLGCARAHTRHDARVVTCDACCGWYHPACARARLPARTARLWLCQRCLLSPVHAARCELYLLSAELAHQTVALLGRLARALAHHPLAALDPAPLFNSLYNALVQAVRTELQNAARRTVDFYSSLNQLVCDCSFFSFIVHACSLVGVVVALSLSTQTQRFEEEENYPQKFYTRDITQHIKRTRSSSSIASEEPSSSTPTGMDT